MIKKMTVGARLLKIFAGVALLCASWMAAPPSLSLAETQAAQWYVGSAGNDTSGCGTTTESLCKTISYLLLLPAFTVGDQINVIDGITDNFTLTKNVAIAGATGASINGNGERIITVNAGVNATVSNLTLHHGGGTQDGGLIHNAGTLTINNTVLTQSTLNNADGGAIFNEGTITIAGSNISSNRARYGGAIENQGTLIIVTTAIANNQADYGAGIDNISGGNMHLTRVVVSGNVATASGAGIYNDLGVNTRMWLTDTAVVSNTAQNGDSAGIFNNGQLSLFNVTISNNHISGGQGVAINHDMGLPGAHSSLLMQHVTVAGNTVVNPSSASAVNFSGSATVKNSVIANDGVDNCSGNVASAGYNLSSDGSCDFTQPTDVNNVDARLGVLQHFALTYDTFTHAPASGSPLVNRIPLASCGSANDQRGVTRPQDGACDIGAHEAIPVDLHINAQAAPASLPAGTTLTVTLNVANTGPAIANGVLVTSDLPVGVGLLDCAGATSCVVSNGRLTVTLGTLNAGASVAVTVRLTPQQSGNLALGFMVAGNEWDRDMTNNTATTNNVTVSKSVDLSIRMSGMPTVAAFTLFTMAVEVENKGELAADSPVFNMTLPANVVFISAQGVGWNCNQGAGGVSCAAQAPLAAKTSALVTITLQSGAAPATLQFIGNATSSTFDPNPYNNTITQTLTVGSGSRIALPVVLR